MADAPDEVHANERAKLSEEERAKLERLEMREWLESLDYVLASGGEERVTEILERLEQHAERRGVHVPFSSTTPYVNTIPPEEQPPYPGDQKLERRIKTLIRWNAVSMVVNANKHSEGIGGHLGTYASAATLYEVAFNHVFRGPDAGADADLVYFQGHASPGIYARSFLEGRFDVEQLRNFRRELKETPGLSSYPHPWLMPDYWQFPTVSMGLGPIVSIYQARFNRYLEARKLKPKGSGKVFAYIGDGETDEPETLGAIKFVAREKLDNLIWIINCNLQRLDGPVFGNGQIIQELEGIFRGAGWNVIKVAWGSKWDELLEKDHDGVLVRRFNRLVDGESQRYAAFGAPELREKFFDSPELKELIEGWSDDDLSQLARGGHDPLKVYAAYHRAMQHQGSPTVLLMRTVKGYGLGEAGEALNVAHQQKKLDLEAMRAFRDRFDVPIDDDDLAEAPFFRPPEDSPERRYMAQRREELGGFVPQRRVEVEKVPPPDAEAFEEFFEGTGGRSVSTTGVVVSILRKLLRDSTWGELVVPIVPDEARTFGMESLFRQVGIHSSMGQKYDPVDSDNLLYYKESQDGQILEEGITEAGSMSSFIAAGTAYATHGVTTVPFYIYYSMFGFQRVGDLVWLAADQRAKGFLIGGTAGGTTLPGEGLQHLDGHSHVLALSVPNLHAYDPAFAFEIAIVVREGMRRMYEEQETCSFYLTVTNENYPMPAAPEHVEREALVDGVMRGLYLYRPSDKKRAKLRAQLLGSGSILNEVLEAARILESDYQVAADVWSATSYKGLQRDALAAERWNRLHPEEEPRVPYVASALGEKQGPIIATSDYMKVLPDALARHLPERRLVSLGTDGFGRSEARAELRDHFEVSAAHVVVATLKALSDDGQLEPAAVGKAIADLGIDRDKPDPYLA